MVLQHWFPSVLPTSLHVPRSACWTSLGSSTRCRLCLAMHHSILADMSSSGCRLLPTLAYAVAMCSVISESLCDLLLPFSHFCPSLCPSSSCPHGTVHICLSACPHVHLSASIPSQVLAPLPFPSKPAIMHVVIPYIISVAWCNFSGAPLSKGPATLYFMTLVPLILGSSITLWAPWVLFGHFFHCNRVASYSTNP